MAGAEAPRKSRAVETGFAGTLLALARLKPGGILDRKNRVLDPYSALGNDRDQPEAVEMEQRRLPWRG